MPTRKPFARIDRTLAASAAQGTEPSITSFVAFAEAPEGLPERIDRSFRYELGRGAWVHLQATAKRGSAWRERTAAQLQRAGYELWLDGAADFDARRWLQGAAETDDELVFLQALGTHAEPESWPRRRARPSC